METVGPSNDAPDLFGTDEIRRRVLAAWTDAPVRFREDANTEEDFALGGYRDRLVVELAQNAADAAARQGIPGRLRLILTESMLVAANVGAPLTANGVESLATLRASQKDEASVGRFGVGFAAVLAISDEPAILSRTGEGTEGVRFSRTGTSDVVVTIPELKDELERRDRHVPVLRLPFAANGLEVRSGGIPDGFDTAVVLPLRDRAAYDLTRRLLDEVDDALLLALPGLDRIELEVADADGSRKTRTLADVGDRWIVHRVDGRWSDAQRAELLADRPTEERNRASWSITWALPKNGSAPDVVHAPTPTDEPLSLPALLVASFPLDPSRRHVAPGSLTDRLVRESARAYAALLGEQSVGEQALGAQAMSGADVLALVPTGLPSGALDAALRDAILRELPGTPLLRSLEDGTLLRPRDAVVVDGIDDPVAQVLSSVVAGLTSVPRSGRAAMDALGVRRIPLAELVDELATIATAKAPEWWRELYDSMKALVTDPLARDALGALPVPLADGRTVRGPRGVLLPYGDIPQQALAILAPYGMRIGHPGAVSETLERLGATAATAHTLLLEPAVRAAVTGTAGDVGWDRGTVAEAVLSLVRAAGSDLAPGTLPWLADLELSDSDGEPAPAGALVIPGSDAERLLDPDEFAPVEQALVDVWGTSTLEAVGVTGSLGVLVANDVDPAVLPAELTDLPDVEEWAAELSDGTVIGEFRAIRDLDFVRDDAWPDALRLIATEPLLRQALLAKPSYSAWWIAGHLELQGTVDPKANQLLNALLPRAPEFVTDLDPDVRKALGLLRRLDDLDADDVEVVLAALADPEVELAAGQLLEVWRVLGELERELESPEAPELVRVIDGSGTRLVTDAIVIDSPMWLQRRDLGGLVIGTSETAEALAELFDLPMAFEVAAGKLDEPGSPATVPDAVRSLVPEVTETWWEHENLRVDGQQVDWWVDESGRPHASTTEGLARALAWTAQAWERRHSIAAVLSDPDTAPDLLVEAIFD